MQGPSLMSARATSLAWADAHDTPTARFVVLGALPLHNRDMSPGRDHPTGTLTFLFTDIEGSTRLLQALGEGYRSVQNDHAEIMRKAIAEGDGIEIRTEGDSFFAV